MDSIEIILSRIDRDLEFDNVDTQDGRARAESAVWSELVDAVEDGAIDTYEDAEVVFLAWRAHRLGHNMVRWAEVSEA